MANSAQAEKRHRQSLKRRGRNVHRCSTVKSAVRNVLKAVEAKNLEQAKDAYRIAVPLLDRMVSKELMHKNKVARRKSYLNQKIKLLQQS